MFRALISGAGSTLLKFWNFLCVDKFLNFGAVEFLGVSPETRALCLRFSSGTSGPIRGPLKGPEGAVFRAGPDDVVVCADFKPVFVVAAVAAFVDLVAGCAG